MCNYSKIGNSIVGKLASFWILARLVSISDFFAFLSLRCLGLFYTCFVPALYLFYTCFIPVLYLLYTCFIPVLYLLYTCFIPALYLFYTCFIPALYLFSFRLSPWRMEANHLSRNKNSGTLPGCRFNILSI